jgi:predicted nucleotidyltransferase
LDNYNVKNLINLKKDLEKITEKEVDIMLKKYANPIVLYRAEKDMKYVTQ